MPAGNIAEAMPPAADGRRLGRGCGRHPRRRRRRVNARLLRAVARARGEGRRRHDVNDRRRHARAGDARSFWIKPL